MGYNFKNVVYTDWEFKMAMWKIRKQSDKINRVHHEEVDRKSKTSVHIKRGQRN